nr:helix-turn-helix domain-containing protein [Nocardia arthritidis]
MPWRAWTPPTQDGSWSSRHLNRRQVALDRPVAALRATRRATHGKQPLGARRPTVQIGWATNDVGTARSAEESQLTGVSVANYTGLEQGQARNASAEVLDALALALRLDDDERAHLHDLAAAAPRRRPVVVTESVSPQLRQFHTPAVSFDMSQCDLRDGLTLAPAGEAAATTTTAGLTWRPLRGAPGLTIHLVLPREQSPLHRRIRAVAKNLAHEQHWLPD